MKGNAKIMLLVVFSIFLCLWACRKDSLVRSTSNAVNMTQYLKNNPDDFSELLKILNLSETASFLNAYGSYTMFAPTNTAIKTYLQEKEKLRWKTSVLQIGKVLFAYTYWKIRFRHRDSQMVNFLI